MDCLRLHDTICMKKVAGQHLETFFSFLLTATKKGKAFVEIEEDHSEGEMDVEEAEEVIL